MVTPAAVPITHSDLDSGSLHVSSYVRPGKLFTGNTNLIVAVVAQLKSSVFQQVVDAVIDILRPAASP